MIYYNILLNVFINHGGGPADNWFLRYLNSCCYLSLLKSGSHLYGLRLFL